MTLTVNYSTLDQALVNSSDSEQEQFVAVAREFAVEKDLEFEVIRDIQKSAFYLADDDGNRLEDWDDCADGYFHRICERLTV